MPSVTASTYPRWRATTLGHITEKLEVALVLDLAGDLAGRRVLDVGTGDGTYALAAAERGALVTGIDTSRETLDAAAFRARERGLHIDLREGDVEQLPFEDGSFDAVIAVTVLCVVRDPRHAVAEMARVLAPGGILVIGELPGASTWAAWRRVRGWLGLVVEQTRGAVHYPPLALAARMMGGVDVSLCKLRWPGAAFVALLARRVTR